MKVCVVGTGYVGLVTAACLADLGHDVIGIDQDPQKISMLMRGKMPIYEPGLEPVVKRNQKSKRLSFSTDLQDGVERSQVIFICVNTPPLETGDTDLSSVANVSRGIARWMNGYRLIVSKSTVPVETGKWIKRTVNRYKKNSTLFDVASNPEFLREGTAVEDFMRPERIVLGVESKKAERLLRALYQRIKAPVLVTDITSAELIKHACNSFLAGKISFVNQLAQVCDKVNANILQVTKGMGLDSRIGADFLRAGIGFGGFCFPKDLSAFIRIGEKINIDLKILRAVRAVNDEQVFYFIERVQHFLGDLSGKKIAVLGLTFKPNTDDLRYAPALKLIHELTDRGATVKAYDPIGMEKAGRELPEQVSLARDSYEAMEGAHALIVTTEWNTFLKLDFKKVRRLLKLPYVFDARNALPSEKVMKAGLYYIGVGLKALPVKSRRKQKKK